MCVRRQALLFAATLTALAFSQTAKADLLVNIDKSTQQMTVTVDGVPRYVWPVSSGGRGYDTPNGEFKPFRMDKDHFSREWDDAPMPYSIFFTMKGNAIHGTFETKNLGKAVSHGCVRLSREHAAILWDLVKEQKMANTKVVIAGEIPGAGGAAVARRLPSYRRVYNSDGSYYEDNGQAQVATRAQPYAYQSQQPYPYQGAQSPYYQSHQPSYYQTQPTYQQDRQPSYDRNSRRTYYQGDPPAYYPDGQPVYGRTRQADDNQDAQVYAARPYYAAPRPAPFPFGW